ncbi:hypothetical protein CLOM_g13947 [Closterium sp. NIES-68]|nr:hypothetical protein CLOM_g13947 [Closterium sp. NIES-68]
MAAAAAAAAAASMSHCHRRRRLCSSRLLLLAVSLVMLALAGVTTAVRLPTSSGSCFDVTPNGPCGTWDGFFGECTETATGYKCTCEPTGMVADPFNNGSQTCVADPCKTNGAGLTYDRCGQNGTCTVVGKGNTCTCSGTDLLYNDTRNSQICFEDPCKAIALWPFGPCGKNGTCTVVGMGNTCTCNSTEFVVESGLDATSPQQICYSNLCLSDPCGPYATRCLPLPGYYNCTCAAGALLVGTSAEENTPYCKPSGNCNDGTRYGPCGDWSHQEGECTETATGYSCICGPRDMAFDPFNNGSLTCIDDPCKHDNLCTNGTCTVVGTGNTCTCSGTDLVYKSSNTSQMCMSAETARYVLHPENLISTAKSASTEYSLRPPLLQMFSILFSISMSIFF